MVGANRYIFGERDMCRIELDGEFEDRFIPDPWAVKVKDERYDVKISILFLYFRSQRTFWCYDFNLLSIKSDLFPPKNWNIWSIFSIVANLKINKSINLIWSTGESCSMKFVNYLLLDIIEQVKMITNR